MMPVTMCQVPSVLSYSDVIGKYNKTMCVDPPYNKDKLTYQGPEDNQEEVTSLRVRVNEISTHNTFIYEIPNS